MSDTISCDLKKTPLYDKHVELGAKIVPFSGWNMPVQYTGIIEEHFHTRSKAGIFDICHMGEFWLRGSGAAGDVDNLITCRTDNLDDGQCRYGFLLNEGGGIIDDLIVFKISPEEFLLVVNAGTIDRDKAWIKENISQDTVFEDKSEQTAKIDVQGPSSGEILSPIVGEELIQDLKRFRFIRVDIEGARVLLSRTGYTGERGYELFMPVDAATSIWDILLRNDDVKPIGLGARDTLRLEMGYSLYGSDIDEKHTPCESNLLNFVYMDKNFIGKEALLTTTGNTSQQILTGFITEGRRSARSHFKVLAGGKEAGEVTSGTFSPCLKKGIGLCYIDKEFSQEGQQIVLTDGKTKIEATVKSVPLYSK